jgi:hypothetical protein
MSDTHAQDRLLAELQALLDQLTIATRLWSLRRDFDERLVEAIMARAIVLSHRRYVELIPVYRRLAEELELTEADDAGTVVNEMMLTDDLFKSYDARWLAAGDFERMTKWLGTIFFRRPRISHGGVKNISDWSTRLRQDGVYLSYSSGTSGHFSFVPRDRLTLQALIRNGSSYAPLVPGSEHLSHEHFDCLILGFRGLGMGLQSAGTGLASRAPRSHFLFDVEMSADIIRALNAPASETPGGPQDAGGAEAVRRFVEATAQNRDAAFARSADFLRAARAANRPVLIFGSPFLVKDSCLRLIEAGAIPLPAHSMLISGGGWKSFEGERISRAGLLQLVEEALGIPPSHVIDAYSTSELNCVFSSCAHGLYHVPPLVKPVILDDLLTVVPGDDVTGRFGFLDPFATSYPGFVITGDLARLVRRHCSCGLSGWALAGEIQRAPDGEVKGCGGVISSVLA